MKERQYQRLLVLLPPHRTVAGSSARPQLSSSTVVRYVTLDATGKTERGDAPFPLLPKARQVDLVFDCADVFSAQIDAPKISAAKLQQALPNLLEDRLLTEPADCHFALGARDASSRLPVAVIHRALLTRALDVLSESGVRPRAAYADLYTVPAPADGTLSIRIDHGRGVARVGAHEGFAFEFDGTVPSALLLAIRRLATRRVRAYGHEASRLAALSDALGAPVEIAGSDVDANASHDAVNLLQGSFAVGGVLPGMPRITARSLRAPAIWLGIAGLVWIIGMNAYWFKLERERQSIQESMRTAFRSAFPNLDPDPSLAVEQTRRELRSLRARAGLASRSDFSALNAQAAQLVSAAPLGVLAGLEYRDGSLRLKFKAGAADPTLQNLLRAQAGPLGLSIRFDADGSARIEPAGAS
ncbi:MAG: type II secretion system protein GspL [Gemmatimonadota bacterium]